MQEQVYSLCFMCSVRCPIKVTVDNGQVQFIQGNSHVPGIGDSICPRGVAGISLVNDTQRVQSPMIRSGPGAPASGARSRGMKPMIILPTSSNRLRMRMAAEAFYLASAPS